MSPRDRLLSPLLAPLRRLPAQDAVSRALVAVFGTAALDESAFDADLLHRVPLDRLQATLDALRERHGAVRGCRRQRDLHLVTFERGSELVWARLAPDGTLAALVTGPAALTARSSGGAALPPQSRTDLTVLPPLPDAPPDPVPQPSSAEPAASPEPAPGSLSVTARAEPADPPPVRADVPRTAPPTARGLVRVTLGYLGAAAATAAIPWLTGTATGWLLLVATAPALAWYALRTGPTHALPPWFRALPLAAVALAVLAGLRALPLFGSGLPWSTPGIPEVILFASGLGLAAWTWGRTRPIRPSPSAHPLVLASPLRGGCFTFTEAGGPAVNRYAQESLTPGAPRHRRYAVDLVQLGDDPQWRGRRALGLAPSQNERYAVFGHPVLSPCDGVVVAAVDGLPDHGPYAPAADHPEGNHVAIDTGRALVVLAWLRQDSVRVRRGQHLTVGTPVGAVGDSGDGGEPALHLRAETRTSQSTPGSGAGLPFRIGGLRGLPLRGRRLRVPD